MSPGTIGLVQLVGSWLLVVSNISEKRFEDTIQDTTVIYVSILSNYMVFQNTLGETKLIYCLTGGWMIYDGSVGRRKNNT